VRLTSHFFQSFFLLKDQTDRTRDARLTAIVSTRHPSAILFFMWRNFPRVSGKHGQSITKEWLLNNTAALIMNSAAVSVVKLNSRFVLGLENKPNLTNFAFSPRLKLES
jgi:hypothetical protein